jgi:hypothetical protein
MGYYPSKIVTLLSAVSGGSMSIAVGIAIVALVEVTLAAFGLKVFHVYER